METPVRCGFHHVALRAKDFEAAIEFYKAMGCKEVCRFGSAENPICMLSVGGDNIIEIFAGGSGEAESSPRFEHVAFNSQNVEEDYVYALANGAEPKQEPKDVSLNGHPTKVAFVIGPSGETIELFQVLQ